MGEFQGLEAGIKTEANLTVGAAERGLLWYKVLIGMGELYHPQNSVSLLTNNRPSHFHTRLVEQYCQLHDVMFGTCQKLRVSAPFEILSLVSTLQDADWQLVVM